MQNNSNENILTVIPKILAFTVLLLLAVLFTGTVGVFLIRHNESQKKVQTQIIDDSNEKVVNMNADSSKKESAYTQIGKLRGRTKAPEETSLGSVFILVPWFSYPENDEALFEELSLKTRYIRTLILEYFSKYTKAELKKMGETKIKQDLLEIINNELVLGKIINVYFDDYIFFD